MQTPAKGARVQAIGLWIALSLALVVRVWWLLTVDTQPVTDFNWYFERALSIAHGNGYAVNGAFTAYWPVGYPAVLAVWFQLFGASVLLGKILNTALTLGSIGLSWTLASRLFKDDRIATVTALILAIHPAFVAYSGILASEPLYTVLMLSGTLLCWMKWPLRGHWPWMAGLLFGLNTLVRPQAVLIPALVMACAWLRGRKTEPGGFRSAIALGTLYLALLLCLVPWTVRNLGTFHRPVFVSTNGGDNLLIGNNPLARGTYRNPDTLGHDFRGLSEPDRDRAATRLAMDYLRTHLGETIARWPSKLAGTFLSGTDAPYWAFQTTRGVLKVPGMGADKALFLGFRAYSRAATGVLLWGAIAGLVACWIFRREVPMLGVVLTLYSALLSVVFFGNPRFAFPVLPFLSMHFAQGLTALWDRLNAGRPERHSASDPPAP